MSYAADLHLHSPYAYATSPALTLEDLARRAQLKGIDLLASADFTHPAWRHELRQKLEPSGPGVYRFNGVQFILGTEVSCVYAQGGKSRRVHLLLLAPGLDAAARLTAALAPWGNLESDGRPTLRLSARDLTALALETSPECIVIPAHVWTPWYGVFGSKTGFDRLEDCFQDLTPQIRAVETGLSSDPAMNWPVPELEHRAIVSFSDAHSLPKLGRELTVFEGELSYPGLRQALADNRIAYTVEFYPEEGKYHYDGHRKCGVRQSPEETLRRGDRCPVCRRTLTLGVLHRTTELSQPRAIAQPGPDGFIRSPQGRPPFVRLVPLMEIIGQAVGKNPEAQGVQREYRRIVQALDNELNVLLRATVADLTAAAGETVAQGVLRARHGQVASEPGYDGVYGQVRVWPEDITIPAPELSPELSKGSPAIC
ncbi:MAG: DNA helicase UvrD [Dehalococcoidia bacterium]|nr:DNA helicase UvrD [Dehalococcoidia bacterium]